MNDKFSDQQLAQLCGVIVEGTGEALEQVVLSRLTTIEDDIGSLKTDVSTIKKGQSSQEEQLDRIERKVNATITSTDHLDIRVKTLETKVSV